MEIKLTTLRTYPGQSWRARSVYGQEAPTFPVKPCVDQWLDEVFAGHGLRGGQACC